ncbi:MAG: matrixin family metalloprotease [Acidimicrobiia bacterium]|nr:matrixin family metalloprotease [Acidimicrobiia bacterium]
MPSQCRGRRKLVGATAFTSGNSAWPRSGSGAHTSRLFVELDVPSRGGRSASPRRLFLAQNNVRDCWYYVGPASQDGFPYAQRAAGNQGVALWDETNGHAFDFIYDTDGFPVNWVTYQICGTPNAVGCHYSGAGTSGHFITTRVRIRSNTNNVLSTMGHEFGHAVGLGHSDDGRSIMQAVGENDLWTADIRGRCQIYGHGGHA